MNKELISIIVPVYKVESSLDRCIQSILKQSYKNLEIILVNDGSPDNSGVICDEYAKKDTRVKVIHKKNGGLSDARNAGIQMASGDYIGLVDSDDWIDEDMFDILIDAAKRHKADIACCGFYVVEENFVFERYADGITRCFNKKESIYELIEQKMIGNFAWNKLYKKRLFDKIKYPKGIVYEDILTTYKLFQHSEKVVCCGSAKYYYVMNKESITHKVENLYFQWQAFKEQLCKISEWYPEYSQQCYKRIVNISMRVLFEIKKARWLSVGKKIENIDLTIRKYEKLMSKTSFELSLYLYSKDLFYLWYRLLYKKNNISAQLKLIKNKFLNEK